MKNALALTFVGMTLIACGGADKSATNDNGDSDCSPTSTLKTVVNALTLPSSQSVGFDIDGDGKVDDHFAMITSSFKTDGFNPQPNVDAAVASGTAPLLIQIDVGDATFANDTCTEVELQVATATPSISFSGQDALAIDTAVSQVTIGGTIVNNVFTSEAPSGTPHPLSISVPVASAVVAIPLNAIHLQFTIDATAHTLTSGLIGGAILETDLDNTLIPTLAASLTVEIAAGNDSSVVVSALFDTGGAADPQCDGTCRDEHTQSCAIAGDGIVSACEITSNGLVEALLGPDVAILDASGNVAPDHARTPKDSLSYAIQFTAVGAQY